MQHAKWRLGDPSSWLASRPSGEKIRYIIYIFGGGGGGTQVLGLAVALHLVVPVSVVSGVRKIALQRVVVRHTLAKKIYNSNST